MFKTETVESASRIEGLKISPIKNPPSDFRSDNGSGKKNYGMELILELFGCEKEIITSKEKIQEFIVKICQEINMERYGRSQIKRFGGGDLWGVGYSFLQFLTTSSLAGHFIDNGGIAFINIFSCKEYDAEKAAAFAEKFFKAQKINSQLIIH